MEHSQFSVVAIRLKPAADIRKQIELTAKEKKISAGVILGGVGSLSTVCLRLAGRDEHTILEGKHEVLTLSGMLSEAGVHLHMSVSNNEGHCLGGHVVYGCRVYTTLEVVIGVMPNILFQREMDAATGFPELMITPHGNKLSNTP